jgi:hypothetical protein
VLFSFICARVIIVLAAVAARCLGTSKHGFDGLASWDAHWYEGLAAHGYSHVAPEAIRFFPLLPLIGRLFALPVAGNTTLSLTLICNVAAIGYALLAQSMARDAGLPEPQVRLVAWVIAFAPANFVLSLAYTESVSGLLTCVVFLALRREKWLTAAAAGFSAGLLRPTGVLLVVPALLEIRRQSRPRTGRERVRQVLATLGPVGGLGSYLAWSSSVYGDPLRPLRVQTTSTLRGGFMVDPLSWIFREVADVGSGDPSHAGMLVHVLWAGIALSLLVLAARKLPASYTAFAAVTLAFALTARSMTSFERYAASAVPLLLVVPALMRTRRQRRAVLAGASVILFGYSFAAFAHAYIP